MPLTGWLIQAWGNPTVMQGAAAALCATLPLLPLAPSLPWLVLALFVFGAATGLLDVAMNVQAVAIEQRHGRPIMSGLHGTYSVGGLAGAATAGVLAGHGLPPFPHLASIAVALVGPALVAGRFLLPSAAPEEGAPVFAIPPRALLGLGVLSFCVLLNEGSVVNWSAVYLQNWLGSTPTIAAAGYAVFSLAMAGIRFGGDALTLRLGAERMVRYGGLVTFLGLGAALVIGSIPATVVGFACVGIGMAVTFPLAMSAAGRTPGLAPGSAIGAVATAGYSGVLVGPPLIGVIADSAGLRSGLALVVVLSLITALLAPAVRRD
jgi:MFS family permease